MTTESLEGQKVYGVTVGGKVYWNKRNALGQFVRADGTNKSDRGWTLQAWHAYLSAAHDAADGACKGILLNRDGKRRSVRSAQFFRPNASLRYASAELLDWFEINGPILSYTAFKAQCSESYAA
jgi:hypothetical protein